MSILGTILLALAGAVCLPTAWGARALSVLQVRLLACLGLVLAAAAAILALQPGERAPAWLVAPAAVLASVGLGAAITISALSATRAVAPAAPTAPTGAPPEEASASAAPGATAPAGPDPGAGLLRGGALIGLFERMAIAVTLLAGWPEGLAVVLAVKGLGRFPELKADQGHGASERFILGTFVSVLAAAACAGVGLMLRGN